MAREVALGCGRRREFKHQHAASPAATNCFSPGSSVRRSAGALAIARGSATGSLRTGAAGAECGGRGGMAANFEAAALESGTLCAPGLAGSTAGTLSRRNSLLRQGAGAGARFAGAALEPGSGIFQEWRLQAGDRNLSARAQAKARRPAVDDSHGDVALRPGAI